MKSINRISYELSKRKLKKRSFDFFENAFNGKDVCLVGNSITLFDQNKSTSIDSHEVVVRMNRAWALNDTQKALVGKRIDMLFCSTEIGNLKLANGVCEKIVWMTPLHRPEAYASEIPAAYYPLDYWQELYIKLGARPSTGMMAIDLIKRFQGSGNLTVYGFDFFKNQSWYIPNRPPTKGPHLGDEESLIKQMLGESDTIS